MNATINNSFTKFFFKEEVIQETNKVFLVFNDANSFKRM